MTKPKTPKVPMMTKTRHPATFTPAILARIENDMVAAGLLAKASVLDPFAGVGTVHALPFRTTGIELEPEWAAVAFWTVVGHESICADSLAWMEKTRRRFDAVVTSCCYGNRMADHHENGDACSCRKNSKKKIVRAADPTCKKCRGSGLSPRRSYRHDLGRMPSEGSSAVMHFGPEYRAFHRRAWAGVFRVLKPGGVLYLNSKDFVRNGKVVRVSEWHRRTCVALGFVHEKTLQVPVNGMGYGANRGARVKHELVYVLRKPVS